MGLGGPRFQKQLKILDVDLVYRTGLSSGFFPVKEANCPVDVTEIPGARNEVCPRRTCGDGLKAPLVVNIKLAGKWMFIP